MNTRQLSSSGTCGSLHSLRPKLHPRSQPLKRRAASSAIAAPPQSPRREGPDAPPAALSIQQPSQNNKVWLWDTTKNWATSVWGVLRVDKYLWNSQQTSQRQVKLLGETTERAIKAGQEQQEEAKQSVKTPPINIHSYLFKTGIMEIRYIRMLASLCSLTYSMPRISEKSLFRLHGLKLVTTSLLYERMAKERPRTPSQIFDDADAMAASPQLVAGAYHELLQSAENKVPAMQAIEKLKEAEPLEKMPTPAELVATRLSLAANAAASAAAPIASNISSAAVGITVAPIQAVGSQLQTVAAASQSTAITYLATIITALESTVGNRQITKKQAISSSYWFVADDDQAHTRFFSIQGSNNIDHWRINLTFDPVVFEDPALGLKVHRGVYEAAEVLYEQFLPLVEEHLASSPFAKIVFTGHSLGGSLGTLLMLMFLHRKIIPPLALGPVYTFGAPAVFCETDPARQPEQVSDGEEASTSGRTGILERLGLNSGAVRNIMMHRDIVPRAFACDYSLVADLLARVHDSFRSLESLRNPERQVMYYFLGQTLVLQPDERQRFVYGGGDHPMLPAGPNIYTLREPWKLSKAADRLSRHISNNIQPAPSISTQTRSSAADPQRAVKFGGAAKTLEPRRTGEANLDEDGANIDDSGPDKAGGTQLGPPARSLKEAVAALMDTPHPLDILGEPGSYGFNGAISRYHDPGNYVKALGGVLLARTRPWKSNGGSAGLSAGELPKPHHIVAPLRRSRKVRNQPPRELSAWSKLAAAG